MKVTRRDFLTQGSGMGMLFAMKGKAGPSSARPNVLILHTDEHNFRTLGCYRRVLPEKEALMWGSPVVETPFIDSIADRGVTADSFYVASPICSPSRASFLCGLYPMDTDVISNDIQMNQEVETFAETLRRHGYATGYSGKWHLDGDPRPGWEPELDFGFTDNRYMFNRGHWKKLELTPDGPRVAARTADGNPTTRLDGADETSFTTDWLTDRTLEFIEEHHDQPFCYMVSYPDPHGPDRVRDPYWDQYRGLPFEVPYTAFKDSDQAWARMQDDQNFDDAAYFGMVKCIDDNVGRLLDRLDQLGLTQNTIIVFTADHGDLRGEHGRQNKGVPYEGSVKVPFVIAAPGLLPSGIRTDAALNTVDFKPTLLSLLGITPEQPSQGKDASAALRGQPLPEGEDIIFSRSPGIRAGTAWLMAADARYKLIASPVEPIWLIDLKNDPAELVNRAGDPDLKPVLKRMAQALLDYAVTYEDPNLPNGNLRNSLEEAAGVMEEEDVGPLVYEDDFEGDAGSALTTVPNVSHVGFAHMASNTALDGNGRLGAVEQIGGANYRFQMTQRPLTNNPKVARISWTATLRTPVQESGSWIGIGFHEADGGNGMLRSGSNTGPWVQINQNSSLRIRGGHGTAGSEEEVAIAASGFDPGDVITMKFIYDVVNKTADLLVNGNPIAQGVAIEHHLEQTGETVDPVIHWAQIHLRNQPGVKDGGAYVDSFRIEQEFKS